MNKNELIRNCLDSQVGLNLLCLYATELGFLTESTCMCHMKWAANSKVALEILFGLLSLFKFVTKNYG